MALVESVVSGGAGAAFLWNSDHGNTPKYTNLIQSQKQRPAQRGSSLTSLSEGREREHRDGGGGGDDSTLESV